MSLFCDPQEHADNPPESWIASKSERSRAWTLKTRGGTVLSTYRTKRDAEAAKTSGPYAVLYAKETRWYAGETIPGWRPYAECASTTEKETVR